MFWGLAAGRVDGRGFEFEHILQGIQTLNEWALEGRLEVTAISLHTYPFVQDKYVILPHGASMGSGYGPVVVSQEPLEKADLSDIEIAVPGRMTTAFLVLSLYLGGEFRFREVPFDQIMEEVEGGRADAGLLIHEGQLTYERRGLSRVVDLGEWWLLETGLPLPLGINVARRDLGGDVLPELSDVLRDSIRAGPRRTATRRSSTRSSTAAGSPPTSPTSFVGMYVNELTEDYGEEGREAVAELLRRGEEAGAFERPVRVEFVD